MWQKLDENGAGADPFAMVIPRFIICLSLALTPLHVLADTAIIMKALDVTASVPAPPWTKIARIARDAETERTRSLSDRGTDVFEHVYVPKGQSINSWDQLYAVQAETPLAGDAQAHRDLTARAYRADCTNAVLAPVVQDRDRQVFVLFCPSLQGQPHMGEYAVMVVSKRDETVLRVNYRKRVPSFDLTDQSSLPASTDLIKQLVRYLNQARLIPS